MALINVSIIIQSSLRALEKAPLSGGVCLTSYKRNRKIILVRTSSDYIKIIEDGYFSLETSVKFNLLEKELKTMIKREFPRSRKVRLYKFGTLDEMDKTYQKI
jgi:hypothetical protein